MDPLAAVFCQIYYEHREKRHKQTMHFLEAVGHACKPEVMAIRKHISVS